VHQVFYYFDDDANVRQHALNLVRNFRRLLMNFRWYRLLFIQIVSYSTVTLLARFLGWSTLQPRITAI
jgi:hypothetical protein